MSRCCCCCCHFIFAATANAVIDSAATTLFLVVLDPRTAGRPRTLHLRAEIGMHFVCVCMVCVFGVCFVGLLCMFGVCLVCVSQQYHMHIIMCVAGSIPQACSRTKDDSTHCT